ncbi:MAG TPA: flagellar protein FlgN [Oligoflexia bacterium]|nr:flagellar protein FlgN [Oligoflexia bacterium]HMP49781.1 flagellar protein FlgN [Oligoflexia bacterium]
MAANNFEKLLHVLIRESKIQEKLLLLLAEERNHIVYLKADDLNSIQAKKEKLLTELDAQSRERNIVLSTITGETEDWVKGQKKKEAVRLTEIIESCEDVSLRKKLQMVLGDLKKTAPATKKLNAENGDLLKHSLGLVSNTIAILSARPSVEDTNYRKDGRVSGSADGVAQGISPVSSFNRSV